MPTIQTPDGPVPFPDDMSDADIEKALQEAYPGPADQPGAAKHVEGTPFSDIEQPSAKNVDISKGALQGFRNAGEYFLGAPGEIDALERWAVEWLKHTGEDDPNPLTKVMNKWGENYEFVADKLGGGAAADIGIPNKSDIQHLGSMATGIEPYQPTTPEGKLMENFTTGIGGGVAGAGAVGKIGEMIGPRFGQLAAQTGKMLPYAGMGYAGSHGDNIANWLSEQLFGVPTKGHPGVSNALPPVR